MTSVSIVVPCYNYGRFLRECTESVLSQEGVDVRVLILDDASADDSRDVGMAIAAQDSRVEYRRHAENCGHIATYNEGLAWASGDYTVLLSADDMLTPGALLRATGLMDAHPEVGFTFGDNIRLVTGEAVPAPKCGSGKSGWEVWNGLAWLESVCRERETFIDSPEVVVRTSMQKSVGDYSSHLPHTADVEMWLRFAVRGGVGRVDADQAYYRIHNQNMCRDLAPTPLHSLEHWDAAFRSFFNQHLAQLPDGMRLQRIAAASLARQALSAAYSGRHGSDADVRRSLIDFAVKVCPDARTPSGRYVVGSGGSATIPSWATRTIAGAPAFLFRGILKDGSRCVRLGICGNVAGAAFELGRVRNHAALILAAWLRKSRGAQSLRAG